VTVHLGTAPLEYYLPALRGLTAAQPASLREIDEVGYAPLSADAAAPPAPGFTLRARQDVSGLLVYRFLASSPRTVFVSALRQHRITLEQGVPAVLGLSLQPPR
jgi:hypothetical protein